MSLSEVPSQGNVPFSWENKPGISKVRKQECPTDTEHFEEMIKLPPPPCPPPAEKPRVSMHELSVPLPPCTFQPPLRSSSKRGLRKQDDPFLTAYKECTKSTSKGKFFGEKGHRLGKNLFNFSCKRSCSVRDDNLVKVSDLPYSFSKREREKMAGRDGFFDEV